MKYSSSRRCSSNWSENKPLPFLVNRNLVPLVGTVAPGKAATAQLLCQRSPFHWVSVKSVLRKAVWPERISGEYHLSHSSCWAVMSSTEHSSYRVCHSPFLPKGAFTDQPTVSTHAHRSWGLVILRVQL